MRIKIISNGAIGDTEIQTENGTKIEGISKVDIIADATSGNPFVQAKLHFNAVSVSLVAELVDEFDEFLVWLKEYYENVRLKEWQLAYAKEYFRLKKDGYYLRVWDMPGAQQRNEIEGLIIYFERDKEK